MKVYGRGDTEVRALDGVRVDIPSRPLHRDHGPVGFGQVDADALRRRPRHAHARAQSCSATSTSDGLNDRQLTLLRRERVGFVFQAFNLVPTLTRVENITLPLDLAGRQPDQEWLDARDRHRRPGRPPQAPPVRALRRPAATRRRRPRAGEPAGASSSPTSRPATSTPAPAPRSSGFMRQRRRRRSARRSSWSPTTRWPPATPTRSCSSPTAGSSASSNHPHPPPCSTAWQPGELNDAQADLPQRPAHKRRLLGTFLRCCSASPSCPARSCSATRSAPSSAPCSPRGSRSRRRRAAPSAERRRRERRHRARRRRASFAGSARSTGVPAPNRRRRARPNSSEDDRERIGGNGPPTVAGNWIPRTAQPVGSSTAALPRPSTRSSSTVARPTSAHCDVRDQSVVRAPTRAGDVVGIVTFGDRDTLGAATVTFFTTDQAVRRLHVQPGKLTSWSARGRPPGERRELPPTSSRRCRRGTDVETGATQRGVTELEDTGFLGFFRVLVMASPGSRHSWRRSASTTRSIVVAQRTRELGTAAGARRVTPPGVALGRRRVVHRRRGRLGRLGLAAGYVIAAGLKPFLADQIQFTGGRLLTGGLSSSRSSSARCHPRRRNCAGG